VLDSIEYDNIAKEATPWAEATIDDHIHKIEAPIDGGAFSWVGLGD